MTGHIRPSFLHPLRGPPQTEFQLDGPPAEEIGRAMLGHASVTLTLDTYTHLIESQQEDVAERMERVLGGAG